MTLDALRRNRDLLFWTLHAVGWSAYAVAQYLGALLYDKPGRYQVVIVIAACAGFVLSAPLRYVYRGLWARGPRAIVLGVPVLCWTIALVWRLVINLAYTRIVEPGWEMGENPLEWFAGTLTSTWLLLCWSGLYFGIKYYEGLQREREAALRAEALARESQLKMLRYQLNPHFLFNTLNAISTLILDRQNSVADQVVSRLSEFLRYTLDQDPVKKVTLRQEIEALNLYLRIEQLRFGERLRLVYNIDPAAQAALVPSLLLQPLIENAVKYAISPRESGGTIRIEAGVDAGELRLAVADDGPGLPPGARPGNGRGVGLRNTRDRLDVLFGARQRFAVVDAGPGVRVEMTLPFET